MIEKKHNLQAAGSGLPKFENLFIRTILVPLGRLFLGWKSARFWLHYELSCIENMVKGLSEDDLNKRVLIDHILGIEDDTRDWSIALVIEHLMIVNTGIIELVKTLSEERFFDGPISIEAVKPKNQAVSINELKQIIKEYEIFVPRNKNSKMTKAHPWFIEFNNKDWNTFLAIHTWVHKRQIKAILKDIT
ncbi:MAG: hypothetical protein J7M14_06610 [Planctomycetes bacterium]|nr:hypothetical protein [Planctomycetota bacterium]